MHNHEPIAVGPWPEINRDYDYCRGGVYRVLSFAQHATTGQCVIVYCGLSGRDRGRWFVCSFMDFAQKFKEREEPVTEASVTPEAPVPPPPEVDPLVRLGQALADEYREAVLVIRKPPSAMESERWFSYVTLESQANPKEKDAATGRIEPSAREAS